MSTLEKIRTIAKAGRIISRIILVLSVIALVMTLGLFMIFILRIEISSSADFSIRFVFSGKERLEALDVIFYIVTLIAMLISEIYLMNTAHTFFNLMVKSGTPFNGVSTDELAKLGFMTILLPFLIQLMTVVFAHLASKADVYDGSIVMDFNPTPTITLGIMFLFASAISRYGIEIENAHKRRT